VPRHPGHRTQEGSDEIQVIRADARRNSGVRQLIKLIGIGLAITSIVRELRLQPPDRTWHLALPVFMKLQRQASVTL
jgi:hypothetical protein